MQIYKIQGAIFSSQNYSPSPFKLYLFIESLKQAEISKIRGHTETKMTTKIHDIRVSKKDIEFNTTPEPAPQTLDNNKDCGVKIISVSIITSDSSCSPE